MDIDQQGQIVSVQICVGHRKPMTMTESVRVIAEYGIENDRHATSNGPGMGRQVLLMDVETLEVLGLAHGETRENITTKGVNLASILEGQKLELGGEVVLRITGPCVPCSRMDEIRPGLQEEIRERRGMLATVERSGTIKIGDVVRVLVDGRNN